MKKKFTWWQILFLIIEIIALVFFILCLTTDINDDLFLIIALGCSGVVNITSLVINIRQNKMKK